MERILVVDDEQSIRITIREFLLREGYFVDTAEEAETAVEKIKSDCFDVVITDILLPKISGVQLLGEIFQICPFTKVIMITGEPNVSTAAESLRLGACDYLFKPVSKDSLLKSVRNAFNIKALEDQNRKYQENLEALVKERTKELEQAMTEMRSMQKELLHRERLRGLDLIASGIAHDINNSLSPIMMYSEALLEKSKFHDADSLNYIRKIIMSAEQIEKSIRKIGEFHIRNDSGANSQEKIDVEELLSSIVEYFRFDETCGSRNIRITVQSEDNPVRILGKKEEFNEILKEVVKNSIEASGDNGIIILSSLFDGRSVNIAVADYGTGMSEEQIERCCDPYFSSKGPKSNGLGLSKVYGLVCRHNGKMNIESEINKGTKITLSFPPAESGVPETIPKEKYLDEKK